MTEKKDDLAELIEQIEITLSMKEKLESFEGEYNKEFEVLYLSSFLASLSSHK